MENKKLLKFLLKDLSELDELFAEKNGNSFDELEMEFLTARVKGAKKLVQILYEREDNTQTAVENKTQAVVEEKSESRVVEEEKVDAVPVEQKLEKPIIEEETEASHKILNEKKSFDWVMEQIRHSSEFKQKLI